MKKIVSILVALFMIATSLSAFAAIEVDPTSPSSLYFNGFVGKADATGTSLNNANPTELSGTGISANKDHPIDFAFSGEKFTFTRPEGSAKSGLAYVNFGKAFTGNFTFGFDITIDNLTTTNEWGTIYSVTPGVQNTVHQDDTMEKINSGEWYINETDGQAYDVATDVKKASKTAWCFYKTYADGTKSPEIGFKAKQVEVPEEDEELEPLADGDATEPAAPEFIKDANGKLAIFHGDVQLEQGKTYTYKVNVNTAEHTYSTIIVDNEGNVSAGISGECQNAFTELYKLDTSIAGGTDASVTIDNIFVENYFGISIAPSWQANAEGTVTFAATLPVNLTDAEVYINDTFVEDITLTPGKIDYIITSDLPEGTGYGKAVIEIRGKINDEDVKTTAVTDITSSFATGNERVIDTPDDSKSAKGLRAFSSGGTISVPADDTGVWALTEKGQIDVTNFTTPLKGIVEYSFDFKTATNLNQLRIRMTANIGNGAAFTWEKGSGDTYHHFLNGWASRKIGKLGVEYKLNEWNTFKIKNDFYAKKYYAYINGELCEEGTIYATAGVTDQVQDVRMLLNYSGAPNASTSAVLLDNFKFVEYGTVTSPATVSFGYNDGTSVDYADEALTSVELSKVEFKTGLPFDSASITDETAKVVNEDGDKVNDSISYSNGTFTATFGGAILPNGNYKLVIDKAVTLKGNAIGLNREIDFAVKSENSIIAPAANTTVAGKTSLSVYAPNADKVVLSVNDAEVAEFYATEAVNGIYSYEYTPSASGIQIFDAYIYEGGNIKLLTSNFNYLLEAQSMKQANNMNDKKGMAVAACATGEYVDGAGKDGSVAYKITSNVGDDTKPQGNGSSDSNSSSFTPGSNLYRKMVTEFDAKPGANTAVSVEIGYSLSGKTYNDDKAAYKTLYLRGSNPATAIFGSNGTILGTSKTFTADTWYTFKQEIDFDTLTCKWYVDGELLTNDDISGLVSGGNATSYPNWKKDIVITFKYKVAVTPIDKTLVPGTAEVAGVPATLMLDNFNRYSPTSLPAAKTVNGSDSYVIEEGTADAAVVLTRPYDNDSANAFDASLISVKVNGEAYAAATVNVTDGANFTVSGLEGVKAGSKIEIAISKYAFFAGTTTDTDLVIPLYVADKNALCVFPFATDRDGAGNLTAYAKYINGASSVDSYLILTQYANGKLANSKFITNLIEGGESGVIYGTLPNYSTSYDTTIRLWNKADISALAPVAGIPAHNVE